MASTLRDLLMILAAAAVLAFAIDFRFGSQTLFLDFLTLTQEKIRPLAPFAGYVAAHVTAGDYIGLAVISFVSRLFFLPIPAEPYFVFVSSTGANLVLISVVAAALGTAASAFNYFVGMLLSKRVLNDGKAEKTVSKVAGSRFVSPVIFFATLLPVPDVVGLVFGALRVNFIKYLTFTFLGLLAKVYIVVLAYDYVAPYVQALV